MDKRKFVLSEEDQHRIAYDAIQKYKKMVKECKTVRELVIVKNYGDLLLNRLDKWDLIGPLAESSAFELEFYKANEELWSRKELWPVETF